MRPTTSCPPPNSRRTWCESGDSRPRSGPSATARKDRPTRDNPFAGRPYVEETQRSIDREVARLLREAGVTATKLIRDHLDALHQVIDLLLERETIDGTDLAVTIGAPAHQNDHERLEQQRWQPLRQSTLGPSTD